jgi:hypothetical protein
LAKIFNLARVRTATTGTGTLTLGGAVSGFLSFADAGVQDGDEVSYAIRDGVSSEVGTGTYTASGSTLTRTVSKSTNGDAAISLSGNAEVVITPSAENGWPASVTLFEAAGNISATNVQDAIEELDAEKQPLDSDLTAIAALSTTTFGRSLLTSADAATLFGDVKQAATDAASGVVELATAAETTAGSDATLAITPDALAGSDYGKTVVTLLEFDTSTDVATGDDAGGAFFRVPSVLDGWNLVDVAAAVDTAGTTGTTDIQVRRVRSGSSEDMLSTKITIDSGETDSSTAATAAVIDTDNDDVATADRIYIDIDAVSTTAPKGLVAELTFQAP